MRLGLLQCGEIPPALTRTHGDYPAIYADLLGDGFTWQTWRVFDGALPDDAAECDGWVVSGSRHGAYENHDWLEPLQAFLRSVHGTRPLLGICFGHQIVAQALGGRVEKFAGGWAVGRRAYDWDGDVVHLNAWHGDQVVAPPPGARVVMRNDFTQYAGLAIGETTLTVQPHPEFTRDFVADMIPEAGEGVVPEPVLDVARAGLDLPLDTTRAGARLARFLKEAAA